MALYTPPVDWEKAFDICQISQTEQKDGFTSYIIDVKISHCKWHVSRRYKQFVELHEKMVKEHAVDKNLLPPKKIFGNRSESFICERKKALEHYLQSLIRLFTILPESLAIFLDFQKYEVRAITAALSETFFSSVQKMSKYISKKGDMDEKDQQIYISKKFIKAFSADYYLHSEEILLSCVPYEFAPTQLHAISERLKLGDPSYFKNPKQDIAHLVEFVTQLKHLIIVGSSQCLEQSNIIPNELSFDLSLFKSAVTLEVYNCDLTKTLTSVDVLRANLKSLIVHKTLDNISDILLCGVLHWCPITDPLHTWPFWNSITFLNFSHNRIAKINTSIKLLSSVKHIDLSHNEIQVIEHMETLSELSVLNLSHNKIQDVDSLHTRLGNIHLLNLSSNKIKSLQGLSKLFSVSELLLEYNMISSLSEVSYISKLPCLEVLNLQHNPVTLCVDYRPQVLLLFGSLAPELTLDGLKATEKEIDTVSILQALKQARGETSTLANQNLEGEVVSNSYNHHQQIQKYQEQNSPGENTTKKIMSNVYRSSKFRQQVETLRKIGGSDWLRLLNEIHNSKVNTDLTLDQFDEAVSQNDNALQNGNMFIGNKNSNATTSQIIERFTSSIEISYPDWLLCLDASVLQIEQHMLDQQFNETSEEEFSHSNRDCSSLIKTSKLLWVVLLSQNRNLVYEIPVCILLRNSEIVFLELKKISKNSCSGENSQNLTPEFLFIRSISPEDIVSLNVGPCDAYTEIKVKANHNTENIIILMMDIDTTDAFVSECHTLYNIMPMYKLNPFAKKMLELEIMSANFSFADVSVQKQILFGQRVCVSKMLHKCQHGILHYVFITPSHVVLVEERLHILPPERREINESVTQPQFQVCSLVNVHSNVKQIHLRDSSEESDDCNNLSLSNHQSTKNNLFHSVKNLDILYKCGSWLIIEFDSDSLLYLNFFSLKQRNQFLDTFLCVRNQR